MDKKTKKIICAIGIVTIMTGTFAAISPSVIKNDERYTDTDSYSDYYTYDDISPVNQLTFNDEFNRRTFYVQKKMILRFYL